MNDLVDRYLACWNETDPEARRALIAQHWSPRPSYTDPVAAVTGRKAIEETIGAVQERFPGFAFSPVGPVDAHHQQARFTWGLGPADAEPVIVASTSWSSTTTVASTPCSASSTRSPAPRDLADNSLQPAGRAGVL